MIPRPGLIRGLVLVLALWMEQHRHLRRVVSWRRALRRWRRRRLRSGGRRHPPQADSRFPVHGEDA
jgi:hypothetical protein